MSDEASAPGEPENLPKLTRTLDDYEMKHALFFPRPTNYSWPARDWPMWGRIDEFLRQCEERQASPTKAPRPDLQLLEGGFEEWGSVERVTIEQDERDRRYVLGFHLRGRSNHRLHRPRLFDPECAALPLTLILSGGAIGFNDDGGARTHLYFGAGEKVPLRRLLANTAPNYHETDPVSDKDHPYGFRSYLIRDWSEPRELSPDNFSSKAAHTDRKEAREILLTCLRKRGQHLLRRTTPKEILDRVSRAERVVDHAWERLGRFRSAGHLRPSKLPSVEPR